MTKKYGIIGNPIKHSLSPILHNYWFEKYKIDANYSIIEIEKSDGDFMFSCEETILSWVFHIFCARSIFLWILYYILNRI